MSWQPFTADDVLALFNDSEQQAYDAAKGDGADDDLSKAVQFVMDELVAVCKGRTTDIGPAGTVPSGFKRVAIGAAVYSFLNSLPSGKSLLNEERIAANKRYEALIDGIRSGKIFIEPTDESARPPSVAWNSENKIIQRTHPVPPPSQQLPPVQPSPPYANPNINDS